MRFGVVLAVVGPCLMFATHVAARRVAPRPRAAFVELDVLVADDKGQPARGLHQADFQIKEDGLPVTVTTFTEVSAAGISGGEGDRRTVVLLLDDVGPRPTGTLIVPGIARLFVSRARPLDDVAVVRQSHHDDEAVGDLTAALARIDEYRGGAVPDFGRETIEDLLKTVARVARQWEPRAHRRKNLVCIGTHTVCNRYLQVSSHALIWPLWVDALAAAASANLSVYTVDSSGVRGQLALGGGLVDSTGGAAFVSNNYDDAVRRIWDEAGHYYLLGYEPTAGARELHSIEIKMKGAGLHVRARRSRGD
jgi:VWFA-related protein